VTAPGSSSLIDGLMAKGMSASKAMVGSITNSSMNLGDPKSFINNIGGQGSVVQTAISTTTKALIKNGTLTGNESPAQAGGMVMAGLSKGADAVGDALKKGGASLSGMYNDIASGKFAGGLADSKSGTGGLSLSLSGLSDSFSGGLDSLKSGLQKAFASVESSYGKLKGGVVNALGPNNKETAPPSATAKAASDYDSAKAAVAAAEDAVLEAKRAYRQSNSSDDMTKLQTAEANLAAANQKVAQASTGYLKAAVGSATSLLPSSIGGVSLASVSSSLKSGLNSLPGGLGSLLSTNNNKTTVSSASPMTSIINTATTAQSTSVFDKASNFTGDIVGKTATAITTSLNSAMASISATTNGAISAAQTGAAGMMGSLQTSMDGIGSMFGGTKSASAGENTFDRTAITAKTGQLLGDPKIPVPTFSDDVASTDADADYLVSAQADAMTAVENEMANVEAAELELSAIYEKIASGSISEADGNSQIDSQQAKVDQARDALLTAQVKYEASIT
jgi:hypothetical protein